MTLVALMTQPLRVSHLAAYLKAVDDSNPVVIITPDDGVFSNVDVPDMAQIRPPALSQRALPSTSLTSGSLRKRIVRWARGGSRAGMKFDQLMRSAQWRLRYLDRLVSVKRLRTSQARARAEMQAAIQRELEAVHDAEPISRIAVFDVFDLPTALEFGRAHAVPVEVR